MVGVSDNTRYHSGDRARLLSCLTEGHGDSVKQEVQTEESFAGLRNTSEHTQLDSSGHKCDQV